MSLTFRIPFTGALDGSSTFPDKMQFTRNNQTGIIDVRQNNGTPLAALGVFDPAILRSQYAQQNMPDDYLLATFSIDTTNDATVILTPQTRDGTVLARRVTLTPAAPTTRNRRLFTGQILRIRQRGNTNQGGILEVVLIPMLAEKLACGCDPEQAFPAPPPQAQAQTPASGPSSPPAQPQ